jgi:lipase chaperone LimK
VGRRGAAIAGLGALAVVGAIAVVAGRGSPEAPAVRDAVRTAAALGVAAGRGARGTPEIVPPAAVPGSLEGTDADGAVTADAAGHLVVDLELRRLFEHFLAASGEESIAVMRARIIAVLHERLPPAAVAEAIAILDRYLGYRDAARRLAAPAGAAAGLDRVHDLRVTWLSAAVARAFFADEEASIAAALARREVAADPALSAAERERRLAEIEARTPAAVRQARAAATAPIDEMAREAQARASGASEDQIAAVRTAAFGAEAAGRLAALDRAHAAWDARLAAFRAARAALLADPTLDDAERRRRIADLLARSFSAAEQIRVAALAQMSSQPAAAY